jgi:Tol biopolymer transport system component
MDGTLDEDAASGQAGGGPNKAYVRDRILGETEMVSLVDTPTGDEIVNGNALKPDITPDGRFVAFASDASVLQGGESEEAAAAAEAEEETVYAQVFRRDRLDQTTTPVSVAPDGNTFGDGTSSATYGPTISADGTRVAFESDAANLVSGDTNEDTDAFVRDLVSGTTTRISLDETGQQVDMPNPVVAAADESEDLTPNVGLGPAISADGLFVAFESKAALSSDDQNAVLSTCTDESGSYEEVVDVADVYLYGMADGSRVRQSAVDDPADPLAFEATGFRTDGHTGLCVPVSNGVDPAISADGSRVAFVSSGNLTGREVAEEGEGEEPTVATSIEPGVYLHRPNPEPDIVAPRSYARSADYVDSAVFPVRYRTSDPVFPNSGVAKVRLFVERPGSSEFTLVKADVGANIDGVFTFRSGGENGRYRFFTVAVDVAGNVEAAPAIPDSVTVLDTVAPVLANLQATPSPFDISRDGRTVLSTRLSERSLTRVVVLHQGVVIKRFDAVMSPKGLVTRRWNGRNDSDRLVHDGWYGVRIRATDLAGNVTVEQISLRVTR